MQVALSQIADTNVHVLPMYSGPWKLPFYSNLASRDVISYEAIQASPHSPSLSAPSEKSKLPSVVVLPIASGAFVMLKP